MYQVNYGLGAVTRSREVIKKAVRTIVKPPTPTITVKQPTGLLPTMKAKVAAAVMPSASYQPTPKKPEIITPIHAVVEVKAGQIPVVRSVTSPVVSPIRSNTPATGNIPRPSNVKPDVWDKLPEKTKIYLASHSAGIKSTISSVNIINKLAPLDRSIEPQAVTPVPSVVVKPVVMQSTDSAQSSLVVVSPKPNIETPTIQATPIIAPSTVATVTTPEVAASEGISPLLLIGIGIGAYLLLGKAR